MSKKGNKGNASTCKSKVAKFKSRPRLLYQEEHVGLLSASPPTKLTWLDLEIPGRCLRRSNTLIFTGFLCCRKAYSSADIWAL